MFCIRFDSVLRQDEDSAMGDRPGLHHAEIASQLIVTVLVDDGKSSSGGGGGGGGGGDVGVPIKAR